MTGPDHGDTFARCALQILAEGMATELTPSEIETIDREIKESGVLEPTSFDFRPHPGLAHLDASTPEEAASFLGARSGFDETCVVLVLCDGSQSGLRLTWANALTEFRTMYDCADGHLYFVEDGNRLMAIVKMALWVSVLNYDNSIST